MKVSIIDWIVKKLKKCIGIVEDGDTASSAISKGQYVVWKGSLYTADGAISSGTTLSASGGSKNLTAVTDGGLNLLNSKIANIPVIKTNSFTGTTSGSGNVSQGHAKRVIILSAWTDGSDRIVSPFAGSGAGITGQYTWWFQVYTDNASHSVIANTSVTIYYAYIEE